MVDVKVMLPSGESRTVSVERDGTVGDALDKSGFPYSGNTFTIDGIPAGLDDRVHRGDVIYLSRKVQAG